MSLQAEQAFFLQIQSKRQHKEKLVISATSVLSIIQTSGQVLTVFSPPEIVFPLLAVTQSHCFQFALTCFTFST